MSPPKGSKKAASGTAADGGAGAVAATAAGTTPASRAPAGLPAAVLDQHTHVTSGPDLNYNTDTISSAAAYMALGVDNAWSLSEFKKNLGVRITGPTATAATAATTTATTAAASAAAAPAAAASAADPDTLEFDVAGIDASLANALRRILLSELPTVAIEDVFVVDNTSVVACEILAHRLGLVPLAVDPRALASKKRERGEPATESNTVVFKLFAECKRGGGGSRSRRERGKRSSGGGRAETTDDDDDDDDDGDDGDDDDDPSAVTGDRVLSGSLRWLPMGSELPEETGAAFSTSQEARFASKKKGNSSSSSSSKSRKGGDGDGDGGGGGEASASTSKDALDLGPPRPVHDDILLARLRPGQRVELEAHAVVGTGAEHAKWSPVATAWYRLQPELFLAGGGNGSGNDNDGSSSSPPPSSSSNAVTGDDADALAEQLPGLVSVRGAGADRRAVLRSPARGNERLLEKARRLSGEPRFAGKLALKRAKDHFVFCVESVGALPPGELVVRALEVLEDKCDRLMERI